MIVDIFAYNGEKDLLDIRLRVLKGKVDKFIAVQSPTTFTGKPKPIYELPPEVESYVNQEDYTPEEIELAELSPNTLGASHWKHEFLQKERIKKPLEGLDDNDIVFIGDVDEIWEYDPELLQEDEVVKLGLRVYTYWLDNRSDEHFHGTIVAKYKNIKDECLNHLRSKRYNASIENAGWHFTSMGGYENLKKKLEDQYTYETYANQWVMEHLKDNLESGKDFLGRSFKFKLDISEWPQYLKDNKKKYKHLCLADY